MQVLTLSEGARRPSLKGTEDTYGNLENCSHNILVNSKTLFTDLCA